MIIRPFDSGRRERNRKARAARRRRLYAKNRVWWSVLRMLPSPREMARERSIWTGAANDNEVRQ